MNRFAIPFILIAAFSLPGCITVYPLVSVISTAARILYDRQTDKADATISVNQLLAQARDAKAVAVSNGVRRLSLSVLGQHLDEAQKRRVGEFADSLIANGIRQVEIIAGSADTEQDMIGAFASFRRGRNVAETLTGMGVGVRVKMDPKRAPGRIEIVPLPAKVQGDA